MSGGGKLPVDPSEIKQMPEEQLQMGMSLLEQFLKEIKVKVEPDDKGVKRIVVVSWYYEMPDEEMAKIFAKSIAESLRS
ncbi:hypothetical protein [Alphaspiravirus yamagawaense]|uniref:Uncharacterized protein n=1 Tax=Alphaspiravirus yamagawaense TaxID=1157339 RepID=J7Q1Z8_9VIRU|nr:hypothetical protein [Aeropyrum coil-shaped virus]CCG27815.1 hypothetical protein [Aeropyrum coil-shaped virus]